MCRQSEPQRLNAIFKTAHRLDLPVGGFDEMTRLRHKKLVPLETFGQRE